MTIDFGVDPSPRLAAAYCEIARTRMQGVPILNPALQVEAIAFGPWAAHWLGVMLTPWCMNLMLLPRDIAQWQPLLRGSKRTHRFPAGPFEFIAGEESSIGPYETCSLFSPVLEFQDHPTARIVATLAREALFDPRNADPEGERDDSATPGPLARVEAALGRPMSKRDFLRARITDADPR